MTADLERLDYTFSSAAALLLASSLNTTFIKGTSDIKGEGYAFRAVYLREWGDVLECCI